MTSLPHALSGLRWFLLGVVILLASVAQAQHDVILRVDGEEISAKVLVIRPDTISYTRPAATDTLAIATAQVFMIRYANGSKEVMAPARAEPTLGLSRAQATKQGAADARKFFRAPGAFWGTYGATVVYPPAGIITGSVVALIKPPVGKLVVPDNELRQNPDYMSAYQQQAQRKKLGKAAAGFGAGMATLAVAIVAILSSVY